MWVMCQSSSSQKGNMVVRELSRSTVHMHVQSIKFNKTVRVSAEYEGRRQWGGRAGDEQALDTCPKPHHTHHTYRARAMCISWGCTSFHIMHVYTWHVGQLIMWRPDHQRAFTTAGCGTVSIHCSFNRSTHFNQFLFLKIFCETQIWEGTRWREETETRHSLRHCACMSMGNPFWFDHFGPFGKV